MDMKHFRVAACIAWAAVAISNAAPANALAATQGSGSTASCTGGTSTSAHTACGLSFAYTQYIKFLTTPCNSGSGCSSSGTAYTDMIYSTGRKTATRRDEPGDCVAPWKLYTLGTCAC